MIFIIIGIAGLLVTVALFTFFSSPKPEETPPPPPAECCGAHAICEKGLKKASETVEYFDDEELDGFAHTPSDAYTDEQINIFRDILYTLRQEEVGDWLISLEKREIQLPDILRQEALDML